MNIIAKWHLATTYVLAWLSIGCAGETMVSSSSPMPPNWRLTPPISASDKVFFVGRSLAVNVLDERHGVNEAIDDAAFQIAKAAIADVKGTVSIIDSRGGEAIRGRETTGQPSESTVRVDVAAIVSNIRQEDTYWERWSVREEFMGKEFKRYKYYVLVAIPEAELKHLQDDVKKKSSHN